jgi:Glu-tRNA(Gln) amidotransferase subunit E-like FAD-binding protein
MGDFLIMLHWTPIKELIHEITRKHVEKSAVFELLSYIEEEMKKVILQSKIEHKKLNELKKIQGLYQKNRIDKDCIKNVIKTINRNSDSPSASLNGARKVKKRKV